MAAEPTQPQPPAGTPPTNATEEALDTFGFGQAVALARDWGHLLGQDLSAGKASVSSNAAFLDGMRWPALATAVEVEGPTPGMLLVVASMEEAAGFFAAQPAARAQGKDARAEEAVREMLLFLWRASDRSFHRGISDRYKVRQATCQAVRGEADLPMATLAGVWGIRLEVMTPASQSLFLQEIVPGDMAHRMAELRRMEGKATKRSSTTIMTTAVAKARVLVVDDHLLIRRALRWHLEHDGYTVFEAADGVDALHQLVSNRPQLVVLDAMMPEMDGYELCRRIHAVPQVGRIPVIFCSALDSRESVMEALRAGAADYVVKPFEKQVLLAKIAKALAAAGPSA